MRRRFPSALVFVLGAFVGGTLVAARPVLAKRAPPPTVAPVVHGDALYEAPPFDNPCGQTGGCVVARDTATGNQLWALKVYCTRYDGNLEMDVQDVFITSLTVEGERLMVTDEKKRAFTIDLATRDVTGDARGCKEAGCSYAGTSLPFPSAASVWLVLGLMVIVRARARR
jgi:hypothetical protein